jgi:hypothetical protein
MFKQLKHLDFLDKKKNLNFDMQSYSEREFQKENVFIKKHKRLFMPIILPIIFPITYLNFLNYETALLQALPS